MTKRSILIIIPTILFLVTSIFSFLAYRNYSHIYKKAYVSTHILSQRKKISEQDLKEVLVPKEYLSEDVLINKNEIIDKYVKLSFSIPTGSLFYKSALEDNIKDYGNTLLMDNEINYDIYTSEVKVNTGALNVDMKVDVYLTIKDKDKALSDLLISDCPITGLYDANNKLIMSYDKDSRVNIMSLAIDSKYVPILNKALKLGDVNIVAGNNTYDSSLRSKLNEDCSLMSFLQ